MAGNMPMPPSAAAAGAGAGAAAGGMPGGLPGMPGGMPGAGGGDMNAMMQQMAQDPMMQQMMQQYGGGGGDMNSMMQRMSQDPRVRQMMQQYGMGGGMPGMGGGAAAGNQEPTHNEVVQINSLVQLQKIIKDYRGVVIDFWSPRCGPCMRFKPTFEGAAKANTNKNIIFCAVQTDNNREAAIAYSVQSIPQFNFILDGQESTKFVGADPNKFSQALAVLQSALSGKAFEHMSMKYKQFKPMNLLPIKFENQGQINKMKEFIQKFAKA